MTTTKMLEWPKPLLLQKKTDSPSHEDTTSQIKKLDQSDGQKRTFETPTDPNGKERDQRNWIIKEHACLREREKR